MNRVVSAKNVIVVLEKISVIELEVLFFRRITSLISDEPDPGSSPTKFDTKVTMRGLLVISITERCISFRPSEFCH